MRRSNPQIAPGPRLVDTDVAPHPPLCWSADMKAPAFKRMTVPEFLAWAQTQDGGRRQLMGGDTVVLAPEGSAHAQAKRRAANLLEAAILRAGLTCEAFVDGLA